MTARRYPDRPLVGVGALLFSRDLGQVLLVRRAAPPAEGLWSIPGGLVDVGEPLSDACLREVREETGLEASLGQMAKVVERIIPDDQGRVEYHYLIVDFVGSAEGQPRAGSDAGEAAWFDIDRTAQLPAVLGLRRAIERAGQLARGEAPTTPLYELFVGAS